MNKKVISVRAVIVVALLVGVYFGMKGPSEKETTVRIGYLNIVASLPLFVAEEKGFLKDEGVNYETTVIATSNQLVDAVVAGILGSCEEKRQVFLET